MSIVVAFFGFLLTCLPLLHDLANKKLARKSATCKHYCLAEAAIYVRYIYTDIQTTSVWQSLANRWRCHTRSQTKDLGNELVYTFRKQRKTTNVKCYQIAKKLN